MPRRADFSRQLEPPRSGSPVLIDPPWPGSELNILGLGVSFGETFAMVSRTTGLPREAAHHPVPQQAGPNFFSHDESTKQCRFENSFPTLA